MISLVFPSRGRPDKAHQTLTNWLSKSLVRNSIDYILSIDKDDGLKEQYFDQFGFDRIIENNNKSVVEASNIAARCTSGNILIYLSDDFECPNEWDKLISDLNLSIQNSLGCKFI